MGISKNLWSDGRIPYKISNDFSHNEKNEIQNATMEFLVTCVRFIHHSQETNYLDIVKHETDCKSYVGRQNNGPQRLWLTTECVRSRNAILHELMHAIGFDHEQSRHDREKYIEIMYSNMKPEDKHNFDIKNTTVQKTDYDFASVMHYDVYAFSKNNLPTIRIKIPDKKIKANGLSDNDVLEINELYDCSRNCYVRPATVNNNVKSTANRLSGIYHINSFIFHTFHNKTFFQCPQNVIII